MQAGTVAVTGATGFVGRHVVTQLRAAGFAVRGLVRRDDPQLRALGMTLVDGDLGSDARIAALVAGVDAVVHVAGAVRAADALAFSAVNAAGSARVSAAAAERPGRRFLQISSLAARMPALSPYAASKAQGEQAALAHARRMQVVVVRPPGVYGPGDRATLPLVRGLDRGWLVHPRGAAARFSLLFAEDLARLVVALLSDMPATGTVLEPDDGKVGGYSWQDLAGIAAARLGRRVRVVGVPRSPVAVLARLAEWHGKRATLPPILSRGKVAELYHGDWVSDTRGVAAATGWRPRTGFGDGLAASLAWYREAGWL